MCTYPPKVLRDPPPVSSGPEADPVCFWRGRIRGYQDAGWGSGFSRIFFKFKYTTTCNLRSLSRIKDIFGRFWGTI